MDDPVKLVELLSAFLTPVIAIVTTYIAVQQFRTNRFQVKLEMFERRYAIYDAIREFISEAVQSGDFQSKSFPIFNERTHDAYFLFSDEISDYVQLLREKAARLRLVNDKLHNRGLPLGDERSKLAEEDHDLMIWFGHQFETSKELVRPFMRLDL